MPCRNICAKPEYQRPGERRRTGHHTGSTHYANGWKRCNECGVMLKYDGIWCPCCGLKLRMRPRQVRDKREWLARAAARDVAAAHNG